MSKKGKPIKPLKKKKVPNPLNRTFLQIGDDTWQCYMWTAKQYIRLHEDKSGAITDPSTKEIHFRNDNFHFEYVGHEIFHAYWSKFYLDSVTTLDIDDIEEVMASFIGKNLIRLYEDALHVFNELKKDLGE